MVVLLRAEANLYRNEVRFSIGRAGERSENIEVIETRRPALSWPAATHARSPKEKAMSALQAMTIAVAISACVSTILVAGLITPLRAMLRRVCPGPEGENFWARFTVLMLYLSPLLIALVFGVPYSHQLAQLDVGGLAQRVLSSALFGAFAALGGIGLRMATLRTPTRA
jgi:hypothetical protein